MFILRSPTAPPPHHHFFLLLLKPILLLFVGFQWTEECTPLCKWETPYLYLWDICWDEFSPVFRYCFWQQVRAMASPCKYFWWHCQMESKVTSAEELPSCVWVFVIPKSSSSGVLHDRQWKEDVKSLIFGLSGMQPCMDLLPVCGRGSFSDKEHQTLPQREKSGWVDWWGQMAPCWGVLGKDCGKLRLVCWSTCSLSVHSGTSP